MHSAQRCIARTIAQRPALHCAQRFTASVAQCVTLYTPPPPLRRKPSAAEVRRRSRAQRQAGVLRSVQRKHCQCSNDSKRFTRCTRLHLLSAQRIYSAHRYIARRATQCAAMHSAQHCIARIIAQRPALHCAQRFIASVVQCATLYPRLPSSTAQRAALHSAQHYTAPSTASQDKADRSKRTKHIQRAALHSAQRHTVLSATQRFTAPSASLRPALHCAQRRTALYSPPSPPPRALHSAQHCTAPSITLHRAQRAKTRPIAASEPSPLRTGGLLRFLCSISAHENRSADTRARSLC